MIEYIKCAYCKKKIIKRRFNQKYCHQCKNKSSLLYYRKNRKAINDKIKEHNKISLKEKIELISQKYSK